MTIINRGIVDKFIIDNNRNLIKEAFINTIMKLP
jgi:hypothetical protein